MSALPYAPITNHLVNLLSEQERILLLQHCEVVELEFGSVLCESQQHYRYLYFPLSGFISLVTKVTGHKPLEMGLIGNEGMLGVTLALGITTAPMQAVVQGAGTAWRINLATLQQLLLQCPQLQHLLQQYLFVLLSQLSQNAACAHFHELDSRLARWLLMSYDRAHSHSFHLTHQFLADMLGVRRSGVTVAAGIMQQQQLISYSRGMISILNRDALQHAACECYQAGQDDYRRLLGEPTADNMQRRSAKQGTP
ncbi:Crp/Fnr family transcriptional regulator [Rheinheimera baltica]|uniref:Crp/Fnr family transcriptional regulator n=1 Tax=Rheinheimera baltica TaxID=67576 RepID=A0ABT9I119_9GAMM|nr:Crp/Fnr family transcriptional regulator [Rheinheimera baltica]MDP5137069.1 Crp/Fnr family transcriptional regulator [Rheinheimera baltica]MDP5142300.1 Crp/Fnr family transcriptional regulator [Rheinheimera baltica]MDP5150802.1 Crp/Fnr family transcriptional regulator [Rheinheimera baltica]MDP5188351.1 Crp/Fnr family transcriptional regulator [Rheinheimera baltica]